MRFTFKRIAVLILGWAFVLLGVLGLFLPVLQGILFILIGLMILSSEYVWAHHLVEKLKARFPKIAQLGKEASVRAHKWLARISRQEQPPPTD